LTLSADTFTFVAELVRRRSAIQLGPGKEYLVESRLLPLAGQAGLAGVDEYVNTMRNVPHSADHDRVVEALTTNETSWFRDVAPFQALTGHVLPALGVNSPGLTSLRVWSAACSTGQEPYSIAMALLDVATDLAVKITATDISDQVLTRARAGRYSQLEINRGLPALTLVRHFTRAGTEWELSEQVRSMVTFSRHNLLHAPPPGGPFDVIFLRNVLIYFDLETRTDVLRSARRALRPGGFLLLGAVETTFGIDDSWETVPVGRGSVYTPTASGKTQGPP
jgi:chemotaxis protein methyltransferase CheR